jgi:hypothetical protein
MTIVNFSCLGLASLIPHQKCIQKQKQILQRCKTVAAAPYTSQNRSNNTSTPKNTNAKIRHQRHSGMP